MADGPPVGYLVINVLEAAGHDSEDKPVWEPEFKAGYARVEIRGGAKTVRKVSSTKEVEDQGISWIEQLTLEVLEGASELRIMLCRPKESSSERSSSSIVAACGIYMKDILEAAPVDKYFELYKPGGGSAGGFIRVAISFLEPDQVRNGDLLSEEAVADSSGEGKKGGIPGLLVKLGVLAAGAAVLYAVLGRQKGRPAPPAASSNGKKQGPALPWKK